MSNKLIGTKAQQEALNSALDGLKEMQGPLMKALQKAQEIYGYLPLEVQRVIAEKFNVSEEEIYGIVTFYSQFNLKPNGKYKVGICLGTACYVKGSGDILNKFKERMGIVPGETSADGKYTLEATRCIGCCGLAPVLTVNEEVFGKVTVDDVDKILAKYND